MRKLILRRVAAENGGQICSSQVLGELLVRPRDPRKGTNYEEMSIVVPLIRKLRIAGETLMHEDDSTVRYVLLEEAEHGELVARLKGPDANFSANSEDLLDIINDVLAAETVSVTLRAAH